MGRCGAGRVIVRKKTPTPFPSEVGKAQESRGDTEADLLFSIGHPRQGLNGSRAGFLARMAFGGAAC